MAIMSSKLSGADFEIAVRMPQQVHPCVAQEKVYALFIRDGRHQGYPGRSQNFPLKLNAVTYRKTECILDFLEFVPHEYARVARMVP